MLDEPPQSSSDRARLALSAISQRTWLSEPCIFLSSPSRDDPAADVAGESWVGPKAGSCAHLCHGP